MKYFVILLVLVGLFTMFGVMANDVYAPPPPNHYVAFDYAEHVLIGKILSTEILSEQKSQTSSDPDDVVGFMLYEIQVDEFLKNPLEKNVLKVPGRYATEDNSRSNIDPPYEINQKVLLYVQKDEPDTLPNYDLVIRSDESKVIEGSISKPYFLSKSDGQVKHYFPLKQFKSGVPIDEIQCKDNLVLLKKHNDSPACVKPSTKQKLIERGWTTKDDSISKTSINCRTLEQSKETAPFFKTPTYLPEGYDHVCSQSGTPFESYIVYYHREIPYWNIPELISDGAIFIYQIDEKNMLGDKKFQMQGSPEQRIQETYYEVMGKNPSLNPQLVTINGILAYAVDSCPDCGTQTANFTDGTVIQKSTSTETRIKFIDENGVRYMLETTLPLSELIKVAESLQ